MLILTIDVGTTSVKCALVDGGGRLVASGQAPLVTLYPSPGWAQQDPEQYLPATISAIHGMLSCTEIDAHRIVAIGLSGTMNGLIPIDAKGKALYHNIIHADTRASRQCTAFANEIGKQEFYARTGNRIDAHMSLPKAAWVRDTLPSIHAATKWYVSTKDYLRGQLTGVWGFTDPTDASLVTAYNISSGAWDLDLAQMGGMKGKLPDVLPSCDMHHTLSVEAAGWLGLACGIPVAIGAGDGACATLGAGVSRVGQGYACLGSSGWTNTLVDAMVQDDRSFHYSDVGGKLLNFTGTVQCVTAALDFMLFTMFGFSQTPQSFALAEQLVAQSPAGANGLLFSPTLMGERTPLWDPHTRGSFLGMSLSHTRADMVRAVYEGVAHAITCAFAVQVENGVAPTCMTLVGGGARSGIWPSMIASMCNVEVCVSSMPGVATALGAAFAAGTGCGLFGSLEEAAGLVTTMPAIQPDTQEHTVYKREHERYLSIYQRVHTL